MMSGGATIAGTTMQETKLKDFCNKVWMKLGVPERDAKIRRSVINAGQDMAMQVNH